MSENADRAAVPTPPRHNLIRRMCSCGYNLEPRLYKGEVLWACPNQWADVKHAADLPQYDGSPGQFDSLPPISDEQRTREEMGVYDPVYPELNDGFETFQAAEGGPVTTNIDGDEVVTET